MASGVPVSCPQCNAVLIASGTATLGRCKACGTVFELAAATGSPPPPPPRSTKICCQCDLDVAHLKRWKDSTGNYYCETCWDARRAAIAAATGDAGDEAHAGSAARPAASGYPCSVCGKSFTAESVFDTGGQFVCTACYQRSGLASSTETDTPTYACSLCHGQFPAEKVYDNGGRIVCQACYAKWVKPPPALVPPAAGGMEAAAAAATRECPFCAETINARAIKCRFCGEMIEEGFAPRPRRAPSNEIESLSQVTDEPSESDE